MKKYISILIIFMMALSYGCTVFKLPALSNNTGNISGCGSGCQTCEYSNPFTTGIDFFITQNYAINLRLNLCGQGNEIDLQETPIRFDSDKISPIVDCRYYF